MAHHDCSHTIHKSSHHYGWDNSLTPRLVVAQGESVAFESNDASSGQLGPKATVDNVRTLDFGKINPVTGPILVDGAEPGDAIKVTILGFQPSGFGWTANIPGFGLLADQFKEPALYHWRYDTNGKQPAAYSPGGKVPLKAMCGTIGLAPAAPGHHSIVPPRQVGGNMDIRDVGEGTELWLPVEVPGGLFSCGDMHAAQGDGEVCGTAIETAMSIALKFEVEKGAHLKAPRFRTPGPVTRHADSKGYDATTGISPDLMVGARDAVSGMIDLLTRRHKMSAVEAYMLCSVAADLRISEIVDQPNWIVSCYFPRIVFE